HHEGLGATARDPAAETLHVGVPYDASWRHQPLDRGIGETLRHLGAPRESTLSQQIDVDRPCLICQLTCIKCPLTSCRSCTIGRRPVVAPKSGKTGFYSYRSSGETMTKSTSIAGIGRPVARKEDARLLTGQGRFSDDVN